jgi:hypothetical protein
VRAWRMREFDAAQLAGHGDFRSNEVVNKLLIIAKVWVADETASVGGERPAALVGRPSPVAGCPDPRFSGANCPNV